MGLLALGVAGVGACSLGEGITPEACDPDAEPGTIGACVAACDDGEGGIPAGSTDCCLRRASHDYAFCADVAEPDDFRDECADPAGDPCCAEAQSVFDQCMSVGLTGSTSATTGAGGAGGAAGAGGETGSGGAGMGGNGGA